MAPQRELLKTTIHSCNAMTICESNSLPTTTEWRHTVALVASKINIILFALISTLQETKVHNVHNQVLPAVFCAIIAIKEDLGHQL